MAARLSGVEGHLGRRFRSHPGGVLASAAAPCKRSRCNAPVVALQLQPARRSAAGTTAGSVDRAGSGQELQDALDRGVGGLVGDAAPGAVEGALGDVVLLRDGAELLAV